VYFIVHCIVFVLCSLLSIVLFLSCVLYCPLYCYAVKIWPGDLDRWPMTINILQWILTKLGTYLVLRRVWNPIDFEGHRVKFLPHSILVPWKSIGFQTLLWTKYVPSLVKIQLRILILECSQGCYTVKKLPNDLDHWTMTLKINSVPDSPKD
jgi:hypothetical protein